MMGVADEAFAEYEALLRSRDAVIYQRHMRGETYTSIARDMGISVVWASKLGNHWPITERWLAITKRVHERVQAGMGYEEIARELGISVDRVNYLVRSWRRRWIAIQREKRVEYGYA